MVKFSTKTRSEQGLSMVEMSIVMVIIGALVAVVSGGIQLKIAAELRSVMSEIETFRVAIETFEEKYSDLPGDMADAHDYWDDGAGGICGTATECNGDGNGTIVLGTASDSEAHRFWQHLNLAGIVEGNYTGIGGTDNEVNPTTNSPATSRSQGAYSVLAYTDTTNSVKTGTQIVVGAFLASNRNYRYLFTPTEAFSIDTKSDDGIANTGNTTSQGSFDGTSWLTATCLASGNYDKTRSDVECILYFDID